MKGTIFFASGTLCVWWRWRWWPLKSHLWEGMSTKRPTNFIIPLLAPPSPHVTTSHTHTHTHSAPHATLQGEPRSSVSRQKSVVTCFIIVVLCQLENKLSLPDGSMVQKMCSYRILHQPPWLAPSRWYLWTVYKLLTYGILKRFVTFICCHPVYLFYENPTPKVNLPLSTSLTSDWRKNPECNLRTELLNKEAFKPSKCRVPHAHVPDRLLVLTAGGTPVRMGVTFLTYSNDTTFTFCCVEMSASLVQLTWRREWGSHPAERSVVSGMEGTRATGTQAALPTAPSCCTPLPRWAQASRQESFWNPLLAAVRSGASELPPEAGTDLHLKIVLPDTDGHCSSHWHSWLDHL